MLSLAPRSLRIFQRHVGNTLPRAAAAANNNNASIAATTTANIQWRGVKNLLDTRLNKLPATGTQTKIICTIGPATDSPEMIGELLEKGMHIARLNFSHAGDDYSYPQKLVDLLRAAKGKHEDLHAGSINMDLPNNLRGILVDTKGPEIRTGVLPGNQELMEIDAGAQVFLTIEDVSGEAVPGPEDTSRSLQIDYQSICKTVDVGSMILLDDGLIALEVMEIDPKGKFVLCEALNGGDIKKNKGVNLPDMELDLPALTDKDRRDLKWACEVGADFVAASFIRTGPNVRSVIAYLDRCIAELPECKGRPRMRPLVISKIENKEGVDNFDEILIESDGIMVARGDLGVEIPYTKVFAAQKMMVNKCNLAGKPVIVATQMLDSMMRNPRPTRAEVTDVGTAVLDGADAVMLSGETAAGRYPIASLKSMASIAHEADMIQDAQGTMLWNQDFHDKLSTMDQELDAVAASAVKSATTMKACKILLISHSGRVARAVARHKPSIPVLSFCTDPQVARRLQLHRSITPIMLQSTLDPDSTTTKMGFLRAEAIRTAKELGFLKSGDRIILVDRTKGKAHDMHDYAHNMKVITIRETY
jgi:pyruvate kinase